MLETASDAMNGMQGMTNPWTWTQTGSQHNIVCMVTMIVAAILAILIKRSYWG